METTRNRIAHGRAMLNTIEAHMKSYQLVYAEDVSAQFHYATALYALRMHYHQIEMAYRNGLITDPHPRQVGARILPRWEWWLHLVALRFGLGRAES